MCSRKKGLRKSRVGRPKPRSSDRKVCTWCGENIGGKTKNRNVIAARMAIHLSRCSAFLNVLEINNISLYNGDNAITILNTSFQLGGQKYNFT